MGKRLLYCFPCITSLCVRVMVRVRIRIRVLVRFRVSQSCDAKRSYMEGTVKRTFTKVCTLL